MTTTTFLGLGAMGSALAMAAQSLEFTETALAGLVRASLDQRVNVEVLRPVHDLVRRQIAAGFGGQGTARIVEELKTR